LRISQLVAGRTLIPMTPANRNELNMVALIFIARMMMATPAQIKTTFSMEELPVTLFIVIPPAYKKRVCYVVLSFDARHNGG